MSIEKDFKCPKCNSQAYLYKELLPDGKGKICCNFAGCKWESEIFDRHEDIKIETLTQKRKDWNG